MIELNITEFCNNTCPRDYLSEREACFARIDLLTNDPWEAVS